MLHSLRSYGVTHIVVSLGFGGDSIRKYLETQTESLQSLVVTESKAELVDSMLCAQHHLDEHFYLLFADIFCDLDYAAFANGHLCVHSQVSVAAVRRDETKGYGQVRIADAGIAFVPKSEHQGGPGYADTGLMIASQVFFDELKREGRFDDLVSEFFRTNRGHVHVHDGYWFDIGTPNTYERACDFFSAQADFPPSTGA